MPPENDAIPQPSDGASLLEYLQVKFEEWAADQPGSDKWGSPQTLANFVKFGHELLRKNRLSQINYVPGDEGNIQFRLQDGSAVSLVPVDPATQAPGYVDTSGSVRIS